MKRIAVLGISYEALLRSPVPTDVMEIYRGQEMLASQALDDPRHGRPPLRG